jgi:hypothetical protein
MTWNRICDKQPDPLTAAIPGIFSITLNLPGAITLQISTGIVVTLMSPLVTLPTCRTAGLKVTSKLAALKPGTLSIFTIATKSVPAAT